MSTTRIRAAIAVLAVSAVVSSGALAGCSVSRDDEPKAGQDTGGSEPAPAPSDEPTAEPTDPVSPSATTTPTPSSTGAATPAAALLAAAEMPQLNETSPWTEVRTGPAGQRPFGLCQKFDLLSIGALSAVERTFAAGSDTAGQQVAEFPDAQNAVRATKVVEAWHRDCAKRVKGTSVKVRPIVDVAVPSGVGWSYLVSYERRGAGHFHSLGVAVSGTRMSLVRVDHEGQDHNYGPGKDPAELAVKAVSARLG
ncbi:MAG: hypothetical protein JWR85_1173 [Marmoricola sp.]|nr:hypothetical protein [Marmoricola sp.]